MYKANSENVSKYMKLKFEPLRTAYMRYLTFD